MTSFVGEVWINLDRFEYQFRCLCVDIKLLVDEGKVLSGPVSGHKLQRLRTHATSLYADVFSFQNNYGTPPAGVAAGLENKAAILYACVKFIDREILRFRLQSVS